MSRGQTGDRRHPGANVAGYRQAGPTRGVDRGRSLPDLPLPLTSFVGREEVLAGVERLVAGVRLVTLVGPGGCGKTRLALEAARELAGGFGGACWVDLAPTSDSALVAQRVARALGVREVPGQPLATSIAESVGREKVLLFLDNCEHLVESCASLVDTLLQACPNLRVVATSQEVLGVAGEHCLPVPPLSLPETGGPPSVREIGECESVRLFVERAAAVVPGFGLTPENVRAISRVCRRLDGIPLAIELAAAKTKVLSVEQISEKLDDRFRLLVAGTRTALPKHKALRATMDWSYGLLSGDEKALLRRLSAFAGSFTLPAAEAVCPGLGMERDEVLDVLSRLVDKSLVKKLDREGDEARYRTLETVRQYGLEKLREAGEEEDVRDRHALFYVGLAEEAESKLSGAEQEAWLDRLEAEVGNVAAALAWCSTRSGGLGAEVGLRIAGALCRFCYLRGYYDEGRGWLEGALALGGDRQPRPLAKALTGAGVLALLQCDYERAEERLQEGLALYRTLGDGVGVASALQVLGSVARERGSYARAETYHEESLTLWRARNDDSGVARSLNYLGFAAWLQEEHDRASKLCDEALSMFRRLGDAEGIAWALISLGFAALYAGDSERAEALLEGSLATSRRAGYREGIAWSLNGLGVAAHRRGDYERAEALLRESLRIHRELGDRWRIASVLEGLAEAACERGHHERSARLFGAAEALREAIGAPIPPCERALYDRSVSAVRACLGNLAFARAWAQGQTMTPEEATVRATTSGASKTTAPPEAAPGVLSAREIEVLRLVAQGLTDAQAARRLHLSPRTVGHHLRSIYRKLHVPTRTAAAKAALERRLI